MLFRYLFSFFLFALPSIGRASTTSTPTYSELARLPEDSLLSMAEEYFMRYRSSKLCMDLAQAESFKGYVEVRKGVQPTFAAECGNAWT
jgi:hypothetical protein